MRVKPFDPNPAGRFCRVENSMWDIIMPTCTPAEFMILSFIYRKTVGFNRAEDRLSYNQIKDGTGIKGKATINKALDGLEEKYYITRRGVERGSIWYGVNQGLEIEIVTSSEIEPDSSETGSEIEPASGNGKKQLVQKLNQSGSEIEPDNTQLVQKLNTSKDSLKTSLKNSKTHLNNLAAQLAAVCQINIDLASDGNREAIKSLTVALDNQNVNVQDIEAFGKYWAVNDWRGQKGQSPTPKQVGDSWGAFEAHRKNGGQNTPSPDKQHVYNAPITDDQKQILEQMRKEAKC